jgi:SAM-dependent methyltransferase
VSTETSCRSCEATDLYPVLSLGSTPLANSLLTAAQLDDPEPTYPLDLCLCRSCALVQITETVPPDVLFRDYLYFSSFSDTMLRHARELAERLVSEHRLTGDSLVVEAASNDGYLLSAYRDLAVPVLGIEPARNVAEVAEERGVPTIAEFFEVSLAQQLADEGRRADVFHASNVLAHVADLNDFVEGIRILLADDGVAVIEAPYVKDMLDRCEFDTIYHEHLCYFSLTALDALFERHALEAVHVERIPVHGGSLRLFVQRALTGSPSQAVLDLRREEESWGVRETAPYDAFAQRVWELRDDLVGLLGRLKAGGGRIAAYGAAAKGSTLLNVFGIGAETLDFVVDRSTVKIGHYMPGVHLPIDPPERLLDEMPDYLVLLAWNLADEIIDQQAEYRRRGGRFVVPVPAPEVVT